MIDLFYLWMHWSLRRTGYFDPVKDFVWHQAFQGNWHQAFQGRLTWYHITSAKCQYKPHHCSNNSLQIISLQVLWQSQKMLNDRVMFLLNQKNLHLGIDLESLTEQETARLSNKRPGQGFLCLFQHSFPFNCG